MTGGFKSTAAISPAERLAEQPDLETSDDLDDDDDEEDEEPVIFSNGNGVDLPGLSAEDRAVPAGDEDQLDIPAFLKRSNH